MKRDNQFLLSLLVISIGFLVLIAHAGWVHKRLAEIDKSITQIKAELSEEPEIITADDPIEPEAKEPYYYLTNEERTVVEQVVAAESIGEPYMGQIAVADCILNTCEKEGIRPLEAIAKYKYSSNCKSPSYSVKRAVCAVFDDGYKIADGQLKYFYAPKRCVSKWHESQIYIMTIGNHKFFAEK